MKNKVSFFIVVISGIILFSACRKKDGSVSTVQVVSFPVIRALDTSYVSPNLQTYYLGIDITAQIYFFSFPVGSAPALNVTATDSATGTVPVTDVIDGHLDPNTPGLYIYEFSAKSKYGYASRVMYMIAVTNIDPSLDLSGTYNAVRAGDTIPGGASITQMVTGLYQNTDGAVGFGVPTFFVQIDSTHLKFPNQLTAYNFQGSQLPYIGTIGGTSGTINMSAADTTIQYTLVSDTLSLNNNIATFYKP